MGILAWMRRRPPKDDAPQEWWERIGRLEHDMEQLQLAWEETYGKVRRALANLARRQKDESDGEPLTENQQHFGRLSPHQIGEKLREARARYNRGV